MKIFTKKSLCIFIISTLILSLCSCNTNSSTTTRITIAYQYGTGYAPFLIMKHQKLIEKYAEDIEINWQVLNSGAAITEGITSGSIDIAGIGVAPAITAIRKGAPFRIYSGISSQEQGLLTNKPELKSLSDISPDDKIAMVNIGSIQHILLAMLAEKELGNAHALDNNIVAMSHPDGMQALLSKSISCHQTSSPYTLQEKNTKGIHLISDMTDVYPSDAPFIVGVSSDTIHNNTSLYNAIINATKDAIDYINKNKESAASLIHEELGLSKNETLTYLDDDASLFHTDITGIMTMANFMGKFDFIDDVPSISELCYEDTKKR